MGDRKPKKNSSGNADAHKAKAKSSPAIPDIAPGKSDKKGGGKK